MADAIVGHIARERKQYRVISGWCDVHETCTGLASTARYGTDLDGRAGFEVQVRAVSADWPDYKTPGQTP